MTETIYFYNFIALKKEARYIDLLREMKLYEYWKDDPEIKKLEKIYDLSIKNSDKGISELNKLVKRVKRDEVKIRKIDKRSVAGRKLRKKLMNRI